MMASTPICPGPFVLASVLSGYPDSGYLSAIQQLVDDPTIHLPESLANRIQKLMQNPDSLEDLSSEYLSIFDLSKELNPLYETEYGRERSMFKTNELADISGFYRAFGFELDQEATREMLDHISVELEFYSLLLIKLHHLQEQKDQNGMEITFDGMRKFMQDHLGRFSSSIIKRPGVMNSSYYSQVFNWIDSLIQEECLRLQVKPESLSWLSSQSEPDEVSCAAAKV